MQHHLLVSAALTAGLTHEAPGEIVYIPDGSHAITPSINGRPKQVTISIPAGRGHEIAAALQVALAQRQADSVRPHIAFDHRTGPAAALPQEFTYEEGRGILLRLAWTSAGREAVEGRDYSYFSPCFLVDEAGVPSGLPSRGEIGSLVNEPAFREMPRIAAAAATATMNGAPAGMDVAGTTTDTVEDFSPLMNTVLAALHIDPAHPDAESTAGQRVTALLADSAQLAEVQAAMAALTAERDDLKEKVAAAEAAEEQRRRRQGELLALRAVSCGLVPPADEAHRAEIVQAAVEGNGLALRLLSERIAAAEAGGPGARPDLSQPLISIQAAEAGAHGHVAAHRHELTPLERVEAALAAELAHAPN